MSVVYRAEDLRLKRKVALKLLAPELAEDERFRERFLQESELAASIDHPSIVPIYEAGEVEGQLYIAMRYVEGSDLKSLLATERRLEPRRALALLEQVADALDAAHERALVHRDVKPGNILIGARRGREHVYLSDFGLTKRTAEEGSLTESGQLLGTTDYVAPEQIEGQEIDGRADIYSLGCVLYECLTGQVPFRSASKIGLLFAHLNKAPPFVSEHRPELRRIDAVVARAMAKEPQHRYPTCGELVAAARAEFRVTQEAFEPALGASPRLARRTWLLSGLTAVLVAAAVAAAVLLLRGGGGGAEPPFSIKEGALARIDPMTNRLAAVIRLSGAPHSVAIGEGRVWTANFDAGTLSEIDPETDAVATTVGVPGSPTDIAAGEGAAWVTSSVEGEGTLTKITKVDPTSTSPSQRPFRISYGNPIAVAVGRGAVWVAANDVQGSAVLRILPATGAVVATIPLPGRPIDIAAGEQAVWVTYHGSQLDAALASRIDPASDEVVAIVEFPIGDYGGRLAVGEGAVWVTKGNAESGGVYRIDPTRNRVTELVRAAEVYSDVAVGEGSVWLAGYLKPAIWRVDPETGKVVSTIETGPNLVDVAVAAGGVWVAVGGGPQQALLPVKGAARHAR